MSGRVEGNRRRKGTAPCILKYFHSDLDMLLVLFTIFTPYDFFLNYYKFDQVTDYSLLLYKV